MGLTTATAIDTLASINTTGGGVDVDIKDYKGQVDFYLNAKSVSGTSPTLTAKLQSSNLSDGAGYATAGSTDNELREGATTKVELAAAFTQSGAKQIKSIFLKLKKNGTVTETDLTLTIEGDSTGDPDGSAIGTATVSTDDITDEYTDIEFVFTTPVEVADATVYHVVLASDYTASGTNNISWRSNTVASGGNLSHFDATNWAQTTTESLEFQAYQYGFADVTGGTFTEVATTGSLQTVSLNIDNLNRYVRVYRTLGGTSPVFYESVFIRGYKDN